MTHGTKTAYAFLEGDGQWTPLKADSTDGVSNVATVLSTAKAHGRNVNVFIDNKLITRVVSL